MGNVIDSPSVTTYRMVASDFEGTVLGHRRTRYAEKFSYTFVVLSSITSPTSNFHAASGRTSEELHLCIFAE